MRSSLVLAIVIAFPLVARAEGGKAAAGREGRMNRGITATKPNVKTEFMPGRYHGPETAYTNQQAEIYRTTTTKRGETLRVYRMGKTGFKEVAQLVQYKNGTVVALPNKVARTIGATIYPQLRNGVLHFEVRYHSGEKSGFEYDPKTGHVSHGGKYFNQLAPGLSPARVYHEYMNLIDLQSD